MTTIRISAIALAVSIGLAGAAYAAAHAKLMVKGEDQSVAGGTAHRRRDHGWEERLARRSPHGWHQAGTGRRTRPPEEGRQSNVAAILTEPVASGDKLMLMLHSEQGG